MNTRQELKGSLKGIDALVLVNCGQICKMFTVNWHGVKYPKRGLGNIQVRGTRQEHCSESYSIFGFGREKTLHTHKLYTPHRIFSLQSEVWTSCEMWRVRTTQRQCVAPACCFHCCLYSPSYTEMEHYCHTEDLSLNCLCLKPMQHNEIPLCACSSEASVTFIQNVRYQRSKRPTLCKVFSVSWLSCCCSV